MPWIRFTGLLIALATLLAPLSMMSGAHAMPASAIELSPPEHCAGTPAEAPDKLDWSMHCFVACSAITSSAATMPTRVDLVAKIGVTRVFAGLSGRSPEADPPPPRFS